MEGSDNCHVRVGMVSHLEASIHVIYWIHTVTLIHRFLDQREILCCCTQIPKRLITRRMSEHATLILPLQFIRHVGSCWRNVSDSMIIVSLAHRQQEIIFVWLKSVFACNFQ